MRSDIRSNWAIADTAYWAAKKENDTMDTATALDTMLTEKNAGAGEPQPITATNGPITVSIYQSIVYGGSGYRMSARWMSRFGKEIYEFQHISTDAKAALAWCHEHAGAADLDWE
jgi:hypothetical protein